MGNRRAIIGNGILLLTTVALGLLVAEVATRILVPRWHEVWPQSFLRIDPLEGGLKGVPGYVGRLTNLNNEFDVSVELDVHGYRNPVLPGSPELVAFGDSFGFGWGVDRDEIYSVVAAQTLSVAQLNLALPAMDVGDYLSTARSHRALTAGRTILVSLTIENDILDYPTVDRLIRRTAPPLTARVMRWMVANSALVSVGLDRAGRSPALVRLARQFGLFAASGATSDGDRDPVHATADLLDLFRLEVAAARLVLVLVPPRQEFHMDAVWAAMGGELRRRGWTVVDPGRQDGDYFPYDGHWRPATHARVAALVAEALTSVNRQAGR